MPTPAGSPANRLRIDLSNHVGVELGRSATAQTSLGETATRNLAGKPSGEIRLSDLWNKSGGLSVTISSNLVNHTINVSTLPGYVAGQAKIRIRINPGIYVYSTSTSIPALNIIGATSGDNIILENNGYIMGKGGHGGDTRFGKDTGWTYQGLPGGPAINLGYPAATMSIDTTNGYIAGGGGGGGCGSSEYGFGGGGAGGGEGGSYKSLPLKTLTLQGSLVQGGLPGNRGSNGTVFPTPDAPGYVGQGGGGGRILPANGTPGTLVPGSEYGPVGAGGTGGEGGGAGGSTRWWDASSSTGGYGGGSGEVGLKGSSSAGPFSFSGGAAGGGGGGWGARGGDGGGPIGYQLATPGGNGGQAITLNGKSVTFIGTTTGRIFGAIS